MKRKMAKDKNNQTTQKTRTLDPQREKEIWDDVRRFWFYARLPQPLLVEDPDDEDLSIPMEARMFLKAEQGAPEFITYLDNQVYLNMEKILKDFMIKDESELEKAVEFLELHGIGHYSLVPYDFLTKLILTHNSAKALEYQGVAKGMQAQQAGANISNLFEDIVDNNFLLENGDEKGFPHNKDSTLFVYDRIHERKEMDPKMKKAPQKTWNVYLRICEKLWNVDGRWVEKKKFSDEQEKAAERIYVLMKDDMYNSRNWERRVYRFAQILAPFIKEDGDQGEGSKMFENDSSGQGNRMKQMMKQLQKMKEGKGDKGSGGQGQKDLEKKIKQMEKQLENNLKGLANKLNKNGNNRNLMKDYKELLIGTGMAEDEQKAQKWLYRDLANNYSVKFQPMLTVGGQAHPFTPRQWTASQPLTDLDIRYTLQTAGVVIPDITTKAWKYRRSYGFKEGEQPPDVYIILDSSGSMDNPCDIVAPAVLSAKVLDQSARNAGAKVAVKNFSGDGNLITLDETTDEDEIDEYLMHYFGGGTVLPTDDLVPWVKNCQRPKQFVLITDTGVSNFESFYDNAKKVMEMNDKNRGAMFCIKHWNDDHAQKLRKIGWEVFKVDSEADLTDLVIGKTKEIYGFEGKGNYVPERL
ncbi:MAG: hypothetical protein KKA79_08965 [Nanoarchaeota archaeon]|nr:hypothetical protein [Nanoarchaeota archaeon]